MQEPIVIQEETEESEEMRVFRHGDGIFLMSYEGGKQTEGHLFSIKSATRLRDALNMILNQKK